MLSESIQIDATAGRSSYSETPVPPGGVVRALRQAAESTGLDAPAELYNEALRLATDGQLRQARERLSVLLALAPEDGEARLLLAKVHVAGQRWRDALAALDEALACGEEVPLALRQAIEENLAADEAFQDEHRAARAAREQGEIKALRQEARRLRSENAQLVGRNRDLEKENGKWAWTTAGVTTFAILFVLGNILFGGDPSPEAIAADRNRQVQPVTAAAPAVVAPPVVAAAPAEPPSAATPIEQVEGPAVGAQAAAALRAVPGLDSAPLELSLSGTTARLGGAVTRHQQLRDAERALLAVPGIDAVDTRRLEVTARTRGATHVVEHGDSLSSIALRYYGDSTLSGKILKANHAVLKGKPNLQIDQRLALPPVQ